MERTEDRSYVEAIKFAASFLQYKNISVKQTFGSAVSQLYWYYKHLNDKDTAGNESDGFSKEAHKQMDLHNNEIGRTIGEKHKDATENEMADIIYQEIYSTTTQFTWLHE